VREEGDERHQEEGRVEPQQEAGMEDRLDHPEREPQRANHTQDQNQEAFDRCCQATHAGTQKRFKTASALSLPSPCLSSSFALAAVPQLSISFFIFDYFLFF
jgi:hypothetical protein